MSLLAQLPQTQEEVTIAVAIVRGELVRIEEEREVAQNLLETVQGICEHPTREKRDFPEGRISVCMVCGKIGV